MAFSTLRSHARVAEVKGRNGGWKIDSCRTATAAVNCHRLPPREVRRIIGVIRRRFLWRPWKKNSPFQPFPSPAWSKPFPSCIILLSIWLSHAESSLSPVWFSLIPEHFQTLARFIVHRSSTSRLPNDDVAGPHSRYWAVAFPSWFGLGSGQLCRFQFHLDFPRTHFFFIAYMT